MANIVTWKLEDFPAGENPFWHDCVSVGACLGDMLANGKLDEWYIMSSGFSMYDFYLVHKATGKRIGISLEA